LLVTVSYAAFLGLAVRRERKRHPERFSKLSEGTEDELARRRTRQRVWAAVMLCLSYAGGLAGAAIANNGAQTRFANLIGAALIGQIALVTTISMSMAMVRGIWGIRRLRHH
jgi:hypothetical protein